jgi:hypothetical protein
VAKVTQEAQKVDNTAIPSTLKMFMWFVGIVVVIIGGTGVTLTLYTVSGIKDDIRDLSNKINDNIRDLSNRINENEKASIPGRMPCTARLTPLMSI